MMYSTETLIRRLLVGLIAIGICAVVSWCQSCARVPVALTSPAGGGQPAQVAYLTTLGGKVRVTPVAGGDGQWAIVTDHEKSFSDGAQLAGKVVTWSALAKIANTTAQAITDRADTLAAADQAQAAAELDTLAEANRSAEAMEAMNLEAGGATP